MAKPVFHLLYTSSARGHFSPDELERLLVVARERNAALGVTGLLIYCDGSFMQLLEGDASTVRSLYEAIGRDERHTDVRSLFTLETPDRWCADWSMGFLRTTDKSDIDAFVNLAAGLDPIRDRLDENSPICGMLTGFIDRNLRLFAA